MFWMLHAYILVHHPFVCVKLIAYYANIYIYLTILLCLMCSHIGNPCKGREQRILKNTRSRWTYSQFSPISFSPRSFLRQQDHPSVPRCSIKLCLCLYHTFVLLRKDQSLQYVMCFGTDMNARIFCWNLWYAYCRSSL